MFSLLCVVSTLICLCVGFEMMPEPSSYILSFPKGDNPLNVTVVSPPEKNYILLIGDWGAQDSTDLKIQTVVAEKMKAFYTNMTSKGYNLLFVVTVGDNFYFDGQNCDFYTKRWTDIYGELATDYYWLAVMGNHDWGNSDPHAICAWGVPDPYIEPETGIPYAANQLNADKKGCNPRNFYLPDFGYYYTINELNFELIQLEEALDCGTGDFGNQNYKDCNNSVGLGCHWMQKMKQASEDMMLERANTSKNSNFLISQHYPQEAQRLVDSFKANRGSMTTPNDESVWAIYGHNHVQRCERINNITNICDCILTGGGGGCCSNQGGTKGFYVIGFDENKKMTQPYNFNDPVISCQYPCNQTFSNEEIIQSQFNYCCYTTHGQNCHLFDLTKC